MGPWRLRRSKHLLGGGISPPPPTLMLLFTLEPPPVSSSVSSSVCSTEHPIACPPIQLKSKEAKNVGEIMEVFPTFRRLADAFERSNTRGGHSEQTGQEPGHGERESCGEPSRLEVGLAVRQVRGALQSRLHRFVLCTIMEWCIVKRVAWFVTQWHERDG